MEAKRHWKPEYNHHQSSEMEVKKWDLLEGPKGRYGWGHHPYTLLTAIFYVIKTQVEWILFHIQKDNLT